MSRVDALIIATQPTEMDAALDAANGAPEWRPADAAPEPYLCGRFAAEDGGTRTVALARGPALDPLIARLSPACVAVCGVCAVRPGDAVPGDVLLAQPAGRPAPRPDGLPSYRRPDIRDAELWFLERLHHGQDPAAHPAFTRYFPVGTWPTRLVGLVRDGLIRRDGRGWALTETGRLHIAHIVANDLYGPATLPFQVRTGPAAAALGAQATAVANAAARLDVPQWLVAKGVTDHTGGDRFRQFAARAAAEVLFAVLARLRPARPRPAAAEVLCPFD